MQMYKKIIFPNKLLLFYNTFIKFSWEKKKKKTFIIKWFSIANCILYKYDFFFFKYKKFISNFHFYNYLLINIYLSIKKNQLIIII